MSTTTSNYAWIKPSVNDPTDQDLWGGYLNSNLDAQDTLVKSISDTANFAATAVNPQTTNYLVVAGDRNKTILVDATSGNVTISLPAAATATSGFQVTIKKTDVSVNTVTIDPNGAETIDGQATLVLSPQYYAYTIVTNGTAWFIKNFYYLATPNGFLLIQDQKAIGTEGGAFNAGAWRTRTLNTEVFDTIGSTLAANQFTLPAGTYDIEATAPAYSVGKHMSRLQNITDTTTLATGTSEVTASSTSVVTRSIISLRFTITATKTFELQHQCQFTNAVNGFGGATSIATEIYSEVKIWRVS